MLSKALLSNKSYPELSMIFKSAKVLFSFRIEFLLIQGNYLFLVLIE